MSASFRHERPLPKWYPTYRGKPLYNGNNEALAWALDGIGRAVQFIGTGAFFATALLRIAKEVAGCQTEPEEGEDEIPECDATFYGLKPSSLLTTYTMIVGVASAAMLPLMGAVVDYTPHRLRVGQVTSALFTILILPQVFLNEDNVFVMAILIMLSSFIGWAQTGISYAYLPELTTNELLLNDYTKSFTISSFLSMVVYLVCVIAGVTVAGVGDDDIITSRVGMAVAFVVNIVLLTTAWGFLFEKREALHELPADRSLWTIGFVQLYQTGKHVYVNHRALRWFYGSIAMSDGGLQALATIAITYLTDTLQFTATENGLAIMLMLLGSVPGAMISNFATRKSDPIKSSMAALVVLIVTTALFAILLKGPNQHLETYILAFMWGIGTGWKWSVDRLVASSIIPEGQDAELMGVFLFSGQCLSWVPPLLFTTINESGISQQVGVASLDTFFVLAMVCYLFMGGYARARAEVNRETSFTAENEVQSSGDKSNYEPPKGIEHQQSGAEATKDAELNSVP